jgi:hypothetical protein
VPGLTSTDTGVHCQWQGRHSHAMTDARVCARFRDGTAYSGCSGVATSTSSLCDSCRQRLAEIDIARRQAGDSCHRCHAPLQPPAKYKSCAPCRSGDRARKKLIRNARPVKVHMLHAVGHLMCASMFFFSLAQVHSSPGRAFYCVYIRRKVAGSRRRINARVICVTS